MDYLHFASKNNTNHLHNKIARELREAEKRNIKKFSKIVQSSGSETASQLIQLNNDYFRRIRGEILSILKCPKKCFGCHQKK